MQITRRGKPVAVVLPVDEYQRLASEKLEFGTDLVQFRRKYEIAIPETNDQGQLKFSCP